MLSCQTHQAWLDDIPFSRLPKTLQDGIVTVWKLELRYLWIDCLCILQDDNTEKAIEIAKMPHIYRGAYVTISAARARRSDEGFLHDIRVPSEGASVFRMAYACPDGRLGSVFLFDDPIAQLKEPIDDRGWTLEEYLLSPRLLIYGVHGLRFSCQEEVQYADKEASESGLSFDNNGELELLREVPGDSAMAKEAWAKIVGQYSRRSLSNPGDRLLAISGIANYYSGILKDKYLAGIWSGDLPSALMWESGSLENCRPLTYRAPSWSWAAIDDRVFFPRQSKLVDLNLRMIAQHVELVEPAAPFGAVRSGYLILKGLLKPAVWDGDLLYSITPPLVEYLASSMADALQSEPFHETTGLMDVWCLQIYPFDDSKHEGPSGLILARVSERTFRRLGTFTFDLNLKSGDRHAGMYLQLTSQRRQWAEGSKLEEITII
jgi:Heterokaryon incompatibility protein (HET)